MFLKFCVGDENGEKKWAVDSPFDQEITSSELVCMMKYKKNWM